MPCRDAQQRWNAFEALLEAGKLDRKFVRSMAYECPCGNTCHEDLDQDMYEALCELKLLDPNDVHFIIKKFKGQTNMRLLENFMRQHPTEISPFVKKCLDSRTTDVNFVIYYLDMCIEAFKDLNIDVVKECVVRKIPLFGIEPILVQRHTALAKQMCKITHPNNRYAWRMLNKCKENDSKAIKYFQIDENMDYEDFGNLLKKWYDTQQACTMDKPVCP